MPIDGIEWEDETAQANLLKHRVSFETAQYVFHDHARLERFDRSVSNTSREERWQTIGKVGEVLFVVYTERKDNKHLISARIADKDDRRSYSGYYHIDGKGWTRAE
jgi:uncharacterized DUF497 family protein